MSAEYRIGFLNGRVRLLLSESSDHLQENNLRNHFQTIIMLMFTGIIAGGCTSSQSTPAIEITPNTTPIELPISPSDGNRMLSVSGQFTTQITLLGNHVIDGSLDLLSANRIDIPLNGKPMWIVSGINGNEIVFVVALDTGTIQSFSITETSYELYELNTDNVPPAFPPLLVLNENKFQIPLLPDDATTLTSPILLGSDLIYIANNGDIVRVGDSSQTRISINAMPDSRILIDENNHLLLLTQPTDRYAHGILGDIIEPAAIVLLDTVPDLKVITTISISGDDVIEGLYPIWSDLDNDGQKEIIVTLSNELSGARFAAFHEDGSLIAESAPIGLAHRWRHQIGVAQFAPAMHPLLAAVRTPHIGGIVEYFRLNGNKLELVSEVSGFSSHSIGSRNLDSALIGDFNNDGIVELLAPDNPHTSLGIINLHNAITTIPLGGALTSNLSATNLNGDIIVGAGIDGHLLIWIK